jgi:hypothetical protein
MSNSSKYINLITEGMGYLNRIREIKPRKGDAFLCCGINAVYGDCDDVSYQRFDLKVSGADAAHLIRRCEQPVKAERKVLVGFRAGDLRTDLFTYSKGERAGQPGVSLKARLLFIAWINIDGLRVYTAESKPRDEAAANEEFTPDDVPVPNSASRSSPDGDRADSQAMAASF